MYRFKGKLLKLIVEKRRLPNGRQATMELICHPGAVLIVPFLDQKRIIFLKQFRPTIRQYIFELPAGTRNPRERPLDCARREIIEETNYKAGRIQKIGKIYPVPGYSTEIITIFKAERLRRQKGTADPDEIIETHVFDRKTVNQLFKKGKIVDAKTICALAFCGWL